jgi:pilus assembly protein Flp/PilA
MFTARKDAGTIIVKMTDVLKRFLRDESGATAIEHGMIVALFCIAVLFAARSISSNITNTFNVAANTMANGY